MYVRILVFFTNQNKRIYLNKLSAYSRNIKNKLNQKKTQWRT